MQGTKEIIPKTTPECDAKRKISIAVSRVKASRVTAYAVIWVEPWSLDFIPFVFTSEMKSVFLLVNYERIDIYD